MTQSKDALDSTSDEYQWLEEVLGAPKRSDATRYLARPSASAPHLLLPLKPRGATAAALRRHHDGRSPKEKVAGLAAEVAGRLGLVHLAGGDVVELAPFALIAQLEDALGERDLVASIAIGPPRRNRKPVIQLLRADGTSVGFVKVGWSTLTKELVGTEAEQLERVAGHLPRPLSAPRVLARLTTPETDTVVTSPLDIKPRARAAPPLEADAVLGLARCRGVEKLGVHELGTVTDMRTATKQLPINVDELVDRHDGVELEAGMWHGDLTPWNMATSHETVMVWDWEFAGLRRPVGFDLLHAAFERVRRAAPANEAAAVDAVLNEASSILRAVRGAALPKAMLEAYRDLYLAELIHRETRLAGEGWTPDNLGPLDQVATAALTDRLAR